MMLRKALDYPRTLREWGRRLEANLTQEMIAQDYPSLKNDADFETFKRKWQYLFAYAGAGFAKGYITCHMLTFIREVSLSDTASQVSTILTHYSRMTGQNAATEPPPPDLHPTFLGAIFEIERTKNDAAGQHPSRCLYGFKSIKLRTTGLRMIQNISLSSSAVTEGT